MGVLTSLACGDRSAGPLFAAAFAAAAALAAASLRSFFSFVRAAAGAGAGSIELALTEGILTTVANVVI